MMLKAARMPGRRYGDLLPPRHPKRMDLPDGLMHVPQIADYLRVSKTSVYKLIKRQKIPAIRIGRLLRVRKDELDETLRAMGNDI